MGRLRNQIVGKRWLAPEIVQMEVYAPEIAERAKPGQFFIVRVEEGGERIPLTLADWDPDGGTITLVAQVVGVTTAKLSKRNVGDRLADVVGPLGNPSKIDKFGRVACVGGGVGVAPIYPIARALKEAGNEVVCIIGARTEGLLFWEERFSFADRVLVTTDDGSYGKKGFVTDALGELLESGQNVDLVYAVGPVVMMRAVSDLTRKYGIRTIVSLNPIMVDGTGMCGACRVTVGGRTRFACVDGPEFDGHQVDFAELMQRLKMYVDMEREAMEKYRKEEGCGR
ncbi:MAG: sulfide/dihydroorotate dehydrogenase-like FAD/NAD-binding protein [Candidatus Latescibacterota bacterium]|nr:MAG: sulfide/dihydroorotate dehydrogenase-like FAD/NAD-binding protein [Candidatus Latescibacterota bacterium]HDI00017.1 sulfide/dihydroorotate dehydrogenase-like FAD/NAD-binding protein [Bacillota bacterium]